MRTLRYVLCDVFTEQPLTGNALAVFTNPQKLSTASMQALAREMNLSESTFIFPAEKGGHAHIRIFTPRVELPFAGHPTLGSAFVIGTGVQLDVLNLETGAGIVPVRLERDGARVAFGWMTQPLPHVCPYDTTPQLLAALGVTGSALPVVAYDNGARHVYVILESREAVASLKPDMTRLAALPSFGVNVFAGEGADYKTRMFHPSAGVAEDPATGSAAGPLAAHLAQHGRIAFGDTIRIEQGAELNRPSILYARAEGSRAALTKVEVGGSAVIVARGEFHLAL
ncbi:MAG TPA: PhzF family phenazine biosynthesis protein [Polyangiaceae bacterium]|nr:PhzF family phenazine biosynthesis protein [Polyangiaceae bacterium]